MKNFKELFKKYDGVVLQVGRCKHFIMTSGTQQMDDILAEIVAFLRFNKLKPEVVSKIESLFYFEEMSEYTPDEEGKVLPHPTTLREDTYYGHAYIKEDNMTEAIEYYNETIVPLMQEYAPKGYYYGVLEGDTSTVGFFPHVPFEYSYTLTEGVEESTLASKGYTHTLTLYTPDGEPIITEAVHRTNITSNKEDFKKYLDEVFIPEYIFGVEG